jgi:iron complex outermembrane receptor protein
MGREFGLDVDLIERIEIVRGPSSSVYGGNALFSVVNVITKPATAIGAGHGVELAGALGSYGAEEARASVGKTLAGGAKLVLSASKYRSDGPVLAFPGESSTGGAPVADTDREENYEVFGKFEDGGFRISVMHSDRDKGITGGLYGLPVDPRNAVTDRHSFIDASYTHQIGAIEWTGRFSYSEYQYVGDYYYGAPIIISKDLAEGAWWNAELKGVTALGAHKLVFGLEYQDNLRQDQSNFDVQPYALYLNDQRKSNRTGLYVQDDFALNERLTLSGGLRYDSYSYGNAEVNPRLGLIYRVNERAVAKLLYGTAFRPANVYESYYYSSPATQSPGLQPESLTTYEAVLETAPLENLRLVATLFRNQIKDLIVYGIDPTTGISQFSNQGRATAEGVEVEAEYAWSGGAKLRANYSFQQTKDDQGNTLSNSPRHLGKLNTSVPMTEKWRAGLEAQYVSSRQTEISNIPAYAIANLTLGSARPWHGWEFYASAYNLFDKKYFDPADLGDPNRDLLEQNGRTYRVKTVFRF